MNLNTESFTRLWVKSALSKPLVIYVLVLLSGFAYSAWVLPVNFLSGNARVYELGDFAQHISGWEFYRADSWHFPLLFTQRINAPEGVSIAFTDSIPLMAIFFKLLSPWLPEKFHYFAIWYVFVFVLQAFSGAFLMRSLGARSMPAALVGASFALLSPSVAWRVGHSALMAHGLIMIALGLYFNASQITGQKNRYAAGLIVICWIGMLIHPYFLAFCFGLLCAYLFDDYRKSRSLTTQIVRVLAALLGVAFIYFVFGYGGSSLSAKGFGLYSMNMLSPLCGGRLTPCFVDATGGQYEGGAVFLGGGILLLMLLCLPVFFKSWRENLRYVVNRHLGLILVLVAFVVYALSNRIYLGPFLLVDVPLPGFIKGYFEIFRASGRFYWTVYYAVIFVVLAYAIKKLRFRWGFALIIIALLVQFWDVSPYRHRMVAKLSEPALHEQKLWADVFEGVKSVNMTPAFSCKDADVNQYFYFQQLASHYSAVLDTGYIARAAISCQVKEEKFHKPFTDGSLYILVAPHFNYHLQSLPEGFAGAISEDACVLWRRNLICKINHDWSDAESKKLGFKRPAINNGEISKMEWPADALLSNIGVVKNGELVPSAPDRHDYLSFGPYVRLPPGAYEVKLHYRSNLSSEQVAGHWDAVAAPLEGAQAKKYDEGYLMGTGGNVGTLAVLLDVKKEDGPLEVRTIYPGKGDLRIVNLVVNLKQ